MTVTWKLRDGLKWSDGEPLTCDDFKYAWEWVLDRTTSASSPSGYEDITDVRLRLRHRRWCSTSRRSTRATSPSRPRRCRATTSRRSRSKDQVNGAGLPRPTRSPSCRSAARSSSSRSPRAASCASSATTNYTSLATGKPAHLDTLDLQVVRRRRRDDRRLQGRRDRLRDRPPGHRHARRSRTSATRSARSRPSLYEFLRPNWSPRIAFDAATRSAAARATPAVAGPRHGLPDGRPGDARGGRLSRSTRTRSTPGSSAAPSRSPTRTSRPARGSTRTRPRPPSIPRRPSRSSRTPAGRPAPTASARRTASRPRSSCAPRPARSARTRSR